MDFKEFANQYLERTSGDDPLSMMSEESLMFVEMLRNEDLTERAETARQVTSSASEPEEDFPSAEAIDSPADETPEITPFAEDFETAQQSEAVSEPGPEPERSEGASEESVVSEALQPVSEPDSQVSIPEVFSEELSDTETIQPRQESGEPAELSSSYTEEGVVAQPAMSEESPVARDAEPLQAAFEDNENAEPISQQSEPGNEPEASEGISEENPELPEVFSGPESEIAEDAEPAAVASDPELEQEGVRVLSEDNTVTLAPPGFPDFFSLLQQLDREVQPPELSSGDLPIPELPEISESEQIQSTTEHAEAMLAEMASRFLQLERRV